MIVFPTVGKTATLDTFLENVDLWYHLYVSVTVPKPRSLKSHFQEADWAGYAPLQAKYWAPALMDGDFAYSTADPLTWTRKAGGVPRTVYGYFVTYAEVGPLLFAEWACNEEGIPMINDGDSLTLWPRLTFPAELGTPCAVELAVAVGVTPAPP